MSGIRSMILVSRGNTTSGMDALFFFGIGSQLLEFIVERTLFVVGSRPPPPTLIECFGLSGIIHEWGIFGGSGKWDNGLI